MRSISATLLSALLLATGSAGATIILPQGAAAFGGSGNDYVFRANGAGMNSFVFYDLVPPRSNAAYLAQRSNAWARYRNGGDAYRRFGMVYTPAAGSTMMGISDRQALAREHIARASAYRLRYFDK